MKVLVLGGTVYVSKEIARLAIEKGHDVTVASRGASGRPPVGAKVITVDRSDSDSVKEALQGKEFDAVIDVSRLPFHVKSVLDVIGEVGHYTLVSSVSVYKDHSVPGQSAATGETLEPTDPDSLDDSAGDADLYGSNKVACENLVRDRYGDRAFIPRPGLIVGPNDEVDRFGYWPWRISQGGDVLAPPADKKLQWIDVRDLAEWIVEAFETTTSGTYDAVGPTITWGEFLPQVAEAVAQEANFVHTTDEFLLENEVKPFLGEDSLGFWLPDSHVGLITHDASEAMAAGLTLRPLSETVAAWQETNTEDDLKAKLSPEKERAVLSAWESVS